MRSRRVHRPAPAPLETDDVKVVAAGTALWALGLVVLVVLRLVGEEVRDWWMVMCAYGIALGLIGTRYCRRRRDGISGRS